METEWKYHNKKRDDECFDEGIKRSEKFADSNLFLGDKMTPN